MCVFVQAGLYLTRAHCVVPSTNLVIFALPVAVVGFCFCSLSPEGGGGGGGGSAAPNSLNSLTRYSNLVANTHDPFMAEEEEEEEEEAEGTESGMEMEREISMLPTERTKYMRIIKSRPTDWAIHWSQISPRAAFSADGLGSKSKSDIVIVAMAALT